MGYVIWVSISPREIGKSSWYVRLPHGRSTLIQIGIGILDLTLCAGAMYMLMPAQPYIDPISLAVIFVTATLLGFASHAPGGLGVFDAAMLVALSQFDMGEMVGALLIFRLFYYIVPFALSLSILGIRELRLGTFGRRKAVAGEGAPAMQDEPAATGNTTSPVEMDAAGRPAAAANRPLSTRPTKAAGAP